MHLDPKFMQNLKLRFRGVSLREQNAMVARLLLHSLVMLASLLH